MPYQALNLTLSTPGGCFSKHGGPFDRATDHSILCCLSIAERSVTHWCLSSVNDQIYILFRVGSVYDPPWWRNTGGRQTREDVVGSNTLAAEIATCASRVPARCASTSADATRRLPTSSVPSVRPPSRVYNRGCCTLGPMKLNYHFPETFVMPCFLSWRSWRLTSSDVNWAPRHQTFVRGPERKVTFTVVCVEQNSVQEVLYVIILGCTPGSDHSNVRCLGDPYLCPRYPYLRVV